MKRILVSTTLAVLIAALPATLVHADAAVVVVEPGHTLIKLVDSKVPLDPSHPALDLGCAFGDQGNIESIGVDPVTGDIYVQIQAGDSNFVSLTTCILQVSPVFPHPVQLINPNTGFGINTRGTDMDFDLVTGLLVTQDQNTAPAAPKRLAFQLPVPGGITGTYAFVPAPIFDGGANGTLGFDFSTGIGDVPAGDLVFTTDQDGSGIHSVTPGGYTGPHVFPLGGQAGDDLVIQPDGTWVHVPDFTGVITAYSPFPGHLSAPSTTGLNLEGMFNDAGLPFTNGSRATVCDLNGNIYVSYSGSPGGSGIFRVDPTLTTATLVAHMDGLQDLTVGPATPGPGFSVFFTAHHGASSGEEIWELTVPECELPCIDPAPLSQGYWHRQCLGVASADGGIDPGRNGRGPQSPTEPDFDKLMPGVSAELGDLLFEFDGSCQGGMDADPPSDKCEKAIKQLTALLFNRASDRIRNSCEVDLAAEGCSSTRIDDLIAEIAGLINSGDPGNCNIAASCAAAVNEGTGLVGNGMGGEVEVAIPVEEMMTLSAGPNYLKAESLDASEIPVVMSEPTTFESSPYVLVQGEAEAISAEPGRSEDSQAETVKPFETIHRHLMIVSDSSADEADRSEARDALLEALGGGHEVDVRLNIVLGLVDAVDVAYESLLASHLIDIRDEAAELGEEGIAHEAARALKRLVPSED